MFSAKEKSFSMLVNCAYIAGNTSGCVPRLVTPTGLGLKRGVCSMVWTITVRRMSLYRLSYRVACSKEAVIPSHSAYAIHRVRIKHDQRLSIFTPHHVRSLFFPNSSTRAIIFGGEVRDFIAKLLQHRSSALVPFAKCCQRAKLPPY